MDSGTNTRISAVLAAMRRGQSVKAKTASGQCLDAQAALCQSNYRFNIASKAFTYCRQQPTRESKGCDALFRAANFQDKFQALLSKACFRPHGFGTTKPSPSETSLSPVGCYKEAGSSLARDFVCEENKTDERSEPTIAANRQCAELLDLYQQIHSLSAHFNKVTEIKPKKVAFEFGALAQMSPADLISYCCREQDTSKQVQSFIELLVDTEAINNLRLKVEREFSNLVLHELGCYIPIALFKISEAFVAFGEAYCIKNLASLTKDKCAVKVMQALAENSNTFSDSFCVYFEKRFDKQIDNQQSVLLLNKVITGVKNESSLLFLVNKLERELQHAELQHQNLLRVVPSLLVRLSDPLREKLATLMRPHIGWLMDHKFGCFTVFGFLSLDCSLSISQAILGIIRTDPASMFTKRYRRFLLTKLVCLPDTTSLYHSIVSAICDSSATTVKRILNHESSAFLLLSALAKTDDLRLMELCNARLSTLDSNNQRVIKGRQGKLVMKWIDLLLESKKLVPTRASVRQ